MAKPNKNRKTQKSFIQDNPALQYISGVEEKQQKKPEQVTKSSNTPPAGYKLDPRYIETKTSRFGLALRPSLLKRIREKAKERDLSVNEYAHQVFEKAVSEDW